MDTLVVRASDIKKTVVVFDKFLKEDINKQRIHDKLIIKEAFRYKDVSLQDSSVYHISLVVVQGVYSDYKYTSITMSELKKYFNKCITKDEYITLKKDFEDLIIKNISNHLNTDDTMKEFEIKLDNPIHLRAQSSMNRCGYGNQYWGDDLMYEGTLYGETTDFRIESIIVKRAMWYF